MLFNGFATQVAQKSLSGITDQWNIANSPAGYAFSIWGIIYTLLAFYTVYQALPEKWAANRNNDLIYNKIGYIYPVNLIFNGLWLVVFGQNAVWSFGVGLAVIIGMLVTQIYVMRLTTRNKVNTWEFITLRCGFTIYSGWVTAATILNVTFFLKSLGLKNDEADKDAGISEDTWSVIILWVALCVYILASFFERNPLYALVYIWVLVGIRKNHEDESMITY
jgi:benzodiazapine receptor